MAQRFIKKGSEDAVDNQNFSLNQFITQDMFISLAGCIVMVAGAVELFKHYTSLSPLILNLIIAGFVTLVRIAIVSDFSFKGIMVGIFNLIPIMLGSTGTYEFVKNIMSGGI